MPTAKEYRQGEYAKAGVLIATSKNVPCSDCGIKYPFYVMDFDHVRGDKLFNVGASRHVGFNKLQKEIEKCDVVCSNCHRLRHPPKFDPIDSL